MDGLISRQVAIDAILHNQEVYSNNFGDDPIDKYTIAIIDNDAQTIAQLPSADRPQGEWKRRLVDSGFNADWVCSECGYRVKTDFVSFNYCPNCGARMKGTDDE